ncbi:MAG: response regulator [Paludisphaera borealis]|uniref:response regulator n=1 Tax=Paludisphaera borealis TaxID=1387353 RepID=UPI00283F9981|nr:response regulator [Paludisphaera borealis]MDR3621614.1 response regulator [Paludisphaera borealis]
MHDMSSVPPAAGVTSRRILVVDDSVDGAQAMALLLKYDGHDTRTAHNGCEAVAEARAFIPEVVFLDIGLPDKNGYEVARELRADPRLRDVVLVALTGWGTDEDRRKSKDAGFDHHFVKPVDVDAVESMLRNLDRAQTPS